MQGNPLILNAMIKPTVPPPPNARWKATVWEQISIAVEYVEMESKPATNSATMATKIAAIVAWIANLPVPM